MSAVPVVVTALGEMASVISENAGIAGADPAVPEVAVMGRVR
jgi:hypothetical protein